MTSDDGEERDVPERETEARLSAFGSDEWEATFDAVQDLVCIIDARHTLVRVNRAMAQYCNAAREELIGRKCYGVVHDTSAPPENCPHAKVMQDGVVQRDQIDRGRVFDVTVSPLHDPQGRVTGCVHVARDVTARARIEAFGSAGQDILKILGEKGSRKEGIERVAGLVRAATGVDAVGIRLEDDDDYPFFYHEGFSDAFVAKEASLLARTREGGICRDDSGNISLECACGVVISGKGDPAKPYFTSGGSCWTNDASATLDVPADEGEGPRLRHECIHSGFSSIALVPIRAKGRIVGLLQLNAYKKGCFTRDAIETLEDVAGNIGEALLRKQAEEKLVASERFLRTLTDQLPGMVSYWSGELRCSFANRGYLQWFGKSMEEMIGIPLQELMGQELFEKNEPHIRRVLQGEPQRFQRTLVKPSGEVREAFAHYIPDLIDGRANGFFAVVSDITELKRSEEEKVKLEVQLQQAQKMESIGRLAGGVAHDFNNMLGVIIGHAELSLLSLPTASPIYDSLIEIRDAAERSANLTRQLLAFASKQTISPRVMDLNNTVSGMLKMLQRLIGEDIHLTWLPDPDLWRVKADPGQVDQILANLCVNARDAIADTGRVTIRTQNAVLDSSFCKAHPGAIPGEYVRLTVTDDGCGIERKTLENIFEPFYTTKETGKGTGLGLATVFGIVKQNNGCIDVYSILGHGTTFSIYLPRLQESVEVPADAEVQPLPRGEETVLVVEDEPTILMMAGMMLEYQGYTVLTAATPDEAIELAGLHRGGVDLLLTDVIMPKMNGRDLARELLSSNPSMKCLFMSGYTSDVIAHHGVLHESVHFIQKPFSLPDLAVQVRDALDG